LFILYPLELSFVTFMLRPGKWKGLCSEWEVNTCAGSVTLLTWKGQGGVHHQRKAEGSLL